jgi:hypothetical protein
MTLIIVGLRGVKNVVNMKHSESEGSSKPSGSHSCPISATSLLVLSPWSLEMALNLQHYLPVSAVATRLSWLINFDGGLVSDPDLEVPLLFEMPCLHRAS